MITLKKACLLATVGAMFTPVAAFAAVATKDVVKDSNRNKVHNTFEHCVITKWDSESDQCYGKKIVEDKISREMLNVYFDFNRSTLNSRERAKLNTVSRLIKQAKEVKAVDIAGYADSIGKDGYNKRLSARRARTVKSYLARKGLRTRKLTVEAFGENNPVTNCDATALSKKDLISCLAEDRRVEIRLIRRN